MEGCRGKRTILSSFSVRQRHTRTNKKLFLRTWSWLEINPKLLPMVNSEDRGESTGNLGCFQDFTVSTRTTLLALFKNVFNFKFQRSSSYGLGMTTNFIFNCATIREFDQIKTPRTLWDCHCANRRWVSAKSTTRNQTSQLLSVGFAPCTIL